MCAAIDVTATSNDGSVLLESALRAGSSFSDYREAARVLKSDGRAVTRAWLAVPEDRAYRDMRIPGLGLGGNLLSLGSMVLYGIEHTGEADANGRRLLAEIKAMNRNLTANTRALEAFTATHPRFCADP